MIDRAFFDAARARVRDRILTTRVVDVVPGVVPAGAGAEVTPAVDDRLDAPLRLKLECLQVTGSFKARGALNRVLALPPEVAARGIVTASGGNHGLAVAFAGHAVGTPTTVYLPNHTSAEKARRIERWGATVVRAGDVWDDAHAAAIARAERDGLTYVHPFADPDVVAGQGTIALELFEQAPDTDALVVAIGGGGLVAGAGKAARLLRPGLRIVGVEPAGAPTLYESLRANDVIELPAIATKAGTLAPRRSERYTFEIVREVVDEIVLVTDDEMRDAARWLLANVGVGVELSGAAAVAAVLARRAPLAGARRPCALVCGAGTDAVPT
ncbi:MAG: pyridoxal-phosphate dependent enzyme [Labilithrix sp.]|nr:pyridoxal-phosphate dependent enzyme [Labilithrix sp.]MCW5814550.1 pyridoxal-phosphate dependent enzyme [Labilithrix sp.]